MSAAKRRTDGIVMLGPYRPSDNPLALRPWRGYVRGMTTTPPAKSRRDTILDTVDDLVSDFLYYDRPEDKDLPPGDIEAATDAKEVSVDEIVERFASGIRKHLGDGR